MDIDGRKVVVARSRARVVIASPVKNGRLSQKAKKPKRSRCVKAVRQHQEGWGEEHKKSGLEEIEPM